VVETGLVLLDALSPPYKQWVIIGIFIVGGICAMVWWWRKNSEEKEPSGKVKQKTKGKNSPAINNVQGNVEINFSKKDDE
jgi:uncharacterized membrane protein